MLRNLVQRLRPIRQLRAFSSSEAPQIVEPIAVNLNVLGNLNVEEYLDNKIKLYETMNSYINKCKSYYLQQKMEINNINY